jgi:biopolymer transport protein ExbD
MTEPNPRILINGDENAFFSQAIYVFDEVRKKGINKVLLETKIRPAGST